MSLTKAVRFIKYGSLAWAHERRCSGVPPGRAPCTPEPGDKSPGYCHMSLRDTLLAHGPKSLLALVERSDVFSPEEVLKNFQTTGTGFQPRLKHSVASGPYLRAILA
jgi:hypothetical protein